MKIDTTTIPKVTITITIDEMFANTLNVYKNIAKELSTETLVEQIGEIHRALYSSRPDAAIKSLFRQGHSATLLNDGMDSLDNDCHRMIIITDGDGKRINVYHQDINF